MTVRENLSVIREEISTACKRVGRDPEEITLIAVTKYASVEKTRELLDAGIYHFGENRDHEFLRKHAIFGDRPTWHFIGTLQSRKVKHVIPYIDYLHSLDRLSLAREIEKRATRPVNCFVQVNVSGEESKHGLAPENVLSFLESLYDYKKIRIVGLMTIAPYTRDERLLRRVFRDLKQLQEDVQKRGFDHAPCTELSMGMSNDFIIAIEEGATMIRIGRKLVGDYTREV
ncbi:MAG: YggS family pyridoxal phosphate-dependent enzyme [Caldibacillus sp.]